MLDDDDDGMFDQDYFEDDLQECDDDILNDDVDGFEFFSDSFTSDYNLNQSTKNNASQAQS